LNAPNRLENLANLRTANLDGAFANAFAALVTGSMLVGFVKYLGGSDIWVGLVGAVPSLLGLLQIPGAIWGRSFSSYKRFVLPGGFLWRLLYVPLIVLPILPISPTAKLFALAFCISFAAAAVLLVNSTYNEWLAHLVPPLSRGYFYSRRNAIASFAAASAGLVGGIVLDVFRARHHEAFGFTAVFALGSFCSAISLYFFLKMRETPHVALSNQSLKDAIHAFSRPLEDANFRRVLLFIAVFIFGQTLAGNLFSAFALESLHLPFTILQMTALCQATGIIVAAAFWGFLSDKYGNKPVLMIVGFGLTLTPAMWLFCYPDSTLHNAAVLLPLNALGGCIWAGVTLSQFNIVLSTSKDDERASSIGMAMAVTAVFGFIAPIAGAQTLTWLRGHSTDAEHAYKSLFMINMALRFVAVFFLWPVVEPGALRLRKTLQDLSRITPKGYSAMRRLSRSSDVPAREEAIRSVGRHGLSLANDELIKALHDPSPRIRRQAASSLARLGDPDAVHALIHQLVEHPDLVEEETVDALGQLAGHEAVEPISKLLRDPRSLVRRAAVRALGRIGDSAAIPALMEIADGSGEADVRRSALRSLRTLEAHDAHEIFARSLLDPAPSVRIAAAEAVAELQLKDAIGNVRQSLQIYHDEACSEVAYALGAIGTDDDIPIILQSASECFSIITRRRCLLGLARLLGVERPAYRLLLLEGMSRDAALLDLRGVLARRNKRMAAALDKYSAGDEPEALSMAATTLKQPVLQWIARKPVEDLFLVVVCYVVAKRK